MVSPHVRATADARVAALRAIAAVAGALLFGGPAFAEISVQDAKSGVVACTPQLLKDHNPGLADNPDRVICFQAYVSNFNTKPRSGKPKYLGVPRWVSHHVKRAPDAPDSGERPNSWFTVYDLAYQGIAPISDSYAFSSKFRQAHKNWYDRGHLAQKYLAERLGNKAAYFTHNVVNAVPQLHDFNAGPWLTLECMTGAWANKYGEVWVVAGPVFKKNARIAWLRSDNHKKATPVAIPSGIFKIVLRKTGDRWDALGFVYPQKHKTYAKGPYDPEVWLKSVADIEQLTGETFLSALPDAAQIKRATAQKIWPVSKSDFDSGCDKQKADVR